MSLNYQDSPDATARAPFGIPPELMAEAWANSAQRPKGVTRYQQFASELEMAASSHAVDMHGPCQAYILARSYAHLMAHAQDMARALRRTTNTIQHFAPGRFDIDPDLAALESFLESFRGE